MGKTPAVQIEDWVGQLDEDVRTHPTPQDMNRGFFIRARYPQVRPKVWPEDAEPDENLIEVQRSSLMELDGVLEDLSPQQQRELAALAIDISVGYGYQDYFRGPVTRAENVATKAPPLVRKIGRKLSSAQDPLERALSFAETLNELSPTPAVKHIRAARDSLHRAIDEMGRGTQYPRPEKLVDPISDATLMLVAYLVHQCGLPRNDVYVRTQKIGTACWGWTGQFNERYDGAYEWKDAGAIRKRIARRGRVRKDT